MGRYGGSGLGLAAARAVISSAARDARTARAARNARWADAVRGGQSRASVARAAGVAASTVARAVKPILAGGGGGSGGARSSGG